MTITYTVKNGLYLNLTNACPNACTFCERNTVDGVGSADSLWLPHDPFYEEAVAALEAYDLSAFDEIVFCGYGEPLCRLDTVVAVSRWLRARNALPIRVNTNGLSDLINGRRTAPELAGLVDAVSISLNAPTAKEYDALCQSVYREEAFPALLRFAADCRGLGIKVTLTAVDVIPPDRLEACRAVAEKLGVAFRVRAAH